MSGDGSVDVLGVAPWVVITAAVTWVSQAWANRNQARKVTLDHGVAVERQRDELTFNLLNNARTEMAAARAEMEGLRGEVKSLRVLEQHFFHFQQSLEHIEALLTATPEDRRQAERNARAFLTRMRRLQDAKGTISNEMARVGASIRSTEQVVEDAFDGDADPDR